MPINRVSAQCAETQSLVKPLAYSPLWSARTTTGPSARVIAVLVLLSPWPLLLHPLRWRYPAVNCRISTTFSGRSDHVQYTYCRLHAHVHR